MPADPPPPWLLAQRWDVGRRIRHHRLRANLTQERLAHALGIERTTLVRIELGHSSPPLDRILEIARALDISPAALMPGGPDPE